MENLEQIIRLVFLLIDAIVVITLVFTLIKGFTKGFYKYLITDGLKWIIILILIMFSGVITNKILTASYPEIGQLNEYLINFMCEEFELEHAAAANSYTYDLIYGIVYSTVRLVIIYLTALVVSLIIYPIISLILRIFGIRKLVSNIRKTIFVRLLGLVLSVVIFGVYFCITYLPYYGTLNIALKVEKDVEILSTQEEKQEVKDITEMKLSDFIDSSFIYPLFKNDDNIAVKYLNSLYVVKVKTQDLYLIEEYYVISDAFPAVIEYLMTSKDAESKLPTASQVETISTVLQNLNSIEVVMPIVVEVAIAVDLFEKYDIDITFEELQDVDWHKEKETLNNIFEDIDDLYAVVYDNQNDLKQIIGTEEFVTVTPKLVQDLFRLYLLREYGYEIITFELEEYIKNNTGSISDLLAMINVKDLIEIDLNIFFEIIQELYKLGIFNKTEDGFNFQIENEQQITNILNTIFSLSFISGNEGKIVEMLVNSLNLEETFESFSFEFNYENINWDEELTHIGHIVYVIYQNPNIADYLNNLNDENKEVLLDLLQTAIKMDLINRSIPKLLDGILSDLMGYDFRSDWLKEQIVTFNEAEFEDEIGRFIDFIEVFQELENGSSDLMDLEPESIKTILSEASKLKSISLDPIVGVLNSELQSYLGTENNYLVNDGNIVWEEEINIIFSEGGIYEQFTNLGEDSSYESYGKLIDSMKESAIFSAGVNAILRDFIKSTSIYKTTENPNGILTDEDLSDSVLNSISSWENELKLLDSIDINAPIQSGETIDTIMDSVLLKRHVKDYVLEIIEEKNLSEYYLAENIEQDIDKVNEYIDETALDSDPNNDYSWQKEVDNLTAFSNKFEEIKAGNVTEESVKELKDLAEAGIITKDIYAKVLEENPALNEYLN